MRERKMKPKGRKMPVIQSETTGVLVAMPNARPGKEGFISIPKRQKRDKLLNFKVNEDMYLFLKTYSGVIGCSMTEIIMRGIECTTGFNGHNGKELIRDMKRYVKETQQAELEFNDLKKIG